MNVTLEAGCATPAGTARYRARFAALPDGHFRGMDGLRVTSLGLGTYLGDADEATDRRYRASVVAALERGLNVIDTAINYRHQRSERVIGAALRELFASGRLARDQVVVCTKGGYLPGPSARARDDVVGRGLAHADEVVGGVHCLAPRYLADQIARSRENLGLACLDVYYLHNPEHQLHEVARARWLERMRAAFAVLEEHRARGELVRYGTATWNGFRVSADDPGHLGLAELLQLAEDVGGREHGLRVVQLPYNLAMPEALASATQAVGTAVVPLLSLARAAGLAVFCSAPLVQGRILGRVPRAWQQALPGLSTDAQRCLQFVRSSPGVTAALAGMSSPAHVEENARVAAVAPLDEAQFAALARS